MEHMAYPIILHLCNGKTKDMEKGTIQIINIEDFKGTPLLLDYADEDFIVADCLENLPYESKMVRLNFFLIVVCMEGRIELYINGKPYLLEAHKCLIVLPTMIISRIMTSPNHKVGMIGISTRFLQRSIKKEKDTGHIFTYLYNNPILDANEEEHDKNFLYYSELILSHIHKPSHRYNKDILRSLITATFYEMLAKIYQYANNDSIKKEEITQSGELFRHFMAAVSGDGGMHRSVNYYADRLCYSPKYVSSVVKKISGRTASSWINEHAIEQIKYQLKHSDKSIKEIAEYFDFPTQSFFGKYVKAHIGMSPASYRRSEEE